MGRWIRGHTWGNLRGQYRFYRHVGRDSRRYSISHAFIDWLLDVP